MSVIQIRDVPGTTHERLKARARQRGQSLSEYLRGELDRLASQPALDEMIRRVATRTPVGGADVAKVLREERRHSA